MLPQQGLNSEKRCCYYGGRAKCKMKQQKSIYQQIVEEIFKAKYQAGAECVVFEREDIVSTAKKLKVHLPKNLGDVIYSFRFRASFPESITSCAPSGKSWIIRLVGRGQYCFFATAQANIIPREDMTVTKIPDATPGIIEKYAFSDEQALLAKLRYNRLVDVFTGIACFSLQNHLRTSVEIAGQIETDEVYVGVDKRGVHYVLPVQAKGGRDKQSIVQAEQDVAMCREKFPLLTCKPIAAQFMADNVIALFELEAEAGLISVASERHYKLVPPEALSDEELASYANRRVD